MPLRHVCWFRLAKDYRIKLLQQTLKWTIFDLMCNFSASGFAFKSSKISVARLNKSIAAWHRYRRCTADREITFLCNTVNLWDSIVWLRRDAVKSTRTNEPIHVTIGRSIVPSLFTSFSFACLSDIWLLRNETQTIGLIKTSLLIGLQNKSRYGEVYPYSAGWCVCNIILMANTPLEPRSDGACKNIHYN